MVSNRACWNFFSVWMRLPCKYLPRASFGQTKISVRKVCWIIGWAVCSPAFALPPSCPCLEIAWKYLEYSLWLHWKYSCVLSPFLFRTTAALKYRLERCYSLPQVVTLWRPLNWKALIFLNIFVDGILVSLFNLLWKNVTAPSSIATY